ncbi:hypothetical protein DSM112329_00410 [Paraconexibacter sp. AEG42_29]|uniref:Uncharacterized protein n=1 Tax=Paraconexibacter sp. AEG42_29 TaxID=2997339 RepID=A0AAU7APL9_9ACTN
MPRRTPLAALLTSAALLTVALPAAADAAPKATQASVSQHIAKAQSAAKKVTRATKKGDVAAARKALKTSRHEAVVASRGARQLAAGAGDSTAAAKTAVWSITAAAGALGESLTRFSNLVPTTGDEKLQKLLAGSLPGTAAGHAQLVEELTALVNELSGGAQALAAQALAALQAAAPVQVQQIAAIAGIDDLPAQVGTLIQTALSTATAALQTGLTELTKLLPVLPAQTEAQISTALGSITSTIHELIPMLTQITGVAITAATNSVKQATGICQSLLSGLLGGFLGDNTPAAGTETGSTGAGNASSGGLLSGLIKIPLSLPSGILGGLSSLLGGGGGLFGGLLGR